MRTYESVFDVDLFVGLLLENVDGAYSGPVTLAIHEEQFYRLKFGDRFFYSFKDGPNPLTEGWYNSMLCFNSEIKHLFCRSTGIDIEIYDR